MSTSDNNRVSDAEMASLLKLLICVGTVEFWVNGQWVWGKNLMTGGSCLFVELATDANIVEARWLSGVENSHGSEYARSQKGFAKRKATRKGKKS